MTAELTILLPQQSQFLMGLKASNCFPLRPPHEQASQNVVISEMKVYLSLGLTPPKTQSEEFQLLGSITLYNLG